MKRLEYIKEPLLTFGSGQTSPSAKDGLFLFGPLQDNHRRGQLRFGLIGTAEGLGHFDAWVIKIRGFVPALDSPSPQHRPFPGFEAVFGVDWPSSPVARLVVNPIDIDKALYISDRHQAVYATVDVFANPIKRYLEREEAPVDVWFVVIPDRVHKYGRPQISVAKEQRLEAAPNIDKKLAKDLLRNPSLFEDDAVAATPYYYEVNFHNQLKARLLEGPNRAVVQIIRETTVAPNAFLNAKGYPVRRVQDPATVAWNLCTTAYFKSGLRPWRLSQVRPNVCYIGLVFKQVELTKEEDAACCGAQMFLDSGDGMVFRGAVGSWRTGRKGEYHLKKDAARELIKTVVDAYKDLHGVYPKELFIHGKTRFNDEEWDGFCEAVPSDTLVVCVRIRPAGEMKLYRAGTHPVLRGTALRIRQNAGYLWTKGYVPYLKTYAGRETPSPLRIEVVRGEADLTRVMEDVMSLTKLNFNACIYGDGQPVTLRFANSVGEILTAGPPNSGQPPLPFKHYV